MQQTKRRPGLGPGIARVISALAIWVVFACRGPAAPPVAGGSSPQAADAESVESAGATQRGDTAPSPAATSTNVSALTGGDPLKQGGPVDCGPAVDNPNGQNLAERRDGSCRPCEHAPEVLPRCPANEQSMPVTQDNLRSHVGKTVSLRGSFGFLHNMCTRRGGPCRCNNTCGAKLQLFPLGQIPKPMTDSELEEFKALPPKEASKRSMSELERLDSLPRVSIALDDKPESGWPYTSESGSLYCGGDEGAMCCPYKFEHYEKWTNAIITGRVKLEPEGLESPPEYHLILGSMCRLP